MVSHILSENCRNHCIKSNDNHLTLFAGFEVLGECQGWTTSYPYLRCSDLEAVVGNTYPAGVEENSKRSTVQGWSTVTNCCTYNSGVCNYPCRATRVRNLLVLIPNYTCLDKSY